MKAYGVRKADAGCCGGHDKYPPPCLLYNNDRGEKRRREQRGRKKTARQAGKEFIRREAGY